MRAIFIFTVFTLSVASSLFLTAEKAYGWGFGGDSKTKISDKIITDSLVRNLSCNNISTAAIYAAIRDDAFDEVRNIPTENWAFNSGGFPIANCWALSSTQRMFSYLARYNESSVDHSEEQTRKVLNMIRRSEPSLDYDHPEKVREFPLRNYEVFKLSENSLGQGYFKGGQNLWTDMANGISGETGKVRRFKGEVEYNQSFRFFRFGNIGMGAGSGARDQGTNVETANQLMRNLSGKRLTLINLRVDQTTQHVVMAKSFTKDASGVIRFTVYDSNQPVRDQSVIFDPTSQQFYAPTVLGTNAALGTFIVSEDERGDFERALLKHYQAVCK
ncbi:hypothetical protein [Bdellovibrio sp. NC01]|uniref:hypothetical protein n=1 Tax=Bdellovibrio sp. NC01 TaxID=2220073 RepID=UPI00115720BD|nr:hypothetical protein [Bdellovibrio sp. NC01]QDK38280.1 hypothetical protein DOE51_12170 [Bdellovibrio sp. NC01]